MFVRRTMVNSFPEYVGRKPLTRACCGSQLQVGDGGRPATYVIEMVKKC